MPAVSLRRSIIGSLKSNPRGDRTPTPSTPDYLRNGTPLAVRLGLQPIEEIKPLPELNRDVDLIVSTGEPADHITIFGEVRPSVQHSHVLFTLSPFLRRKIYGYCFEEEARTVTLSPRFATKAVFADGYFASPWDVLANVSGAMGAFRILRHDVLAYFWTEYHFHVTLTMFSGPKFSPLSHIWLADYLDIIQCLAVEIDLTRFGGSAMKEAPKFGTDLVKLENMIYDIVNGIASRAGSQNMKELRLLCRRYAGFRPYNDFNLEDEVPYMPEYSTYICDALTNLRGVLKQCRISGFSQEYAQLLLSAIFGEGDKDIDYIFAEDGAWPPLHYRPPSPRYGQKVLNTPKYHPFAFQLHLPKSPSFAEEVEDEFQKIELGAESPLLGRESTVGTISSRTETRLESERSMSAASGSLEFLQIRKTRRPTLKAAERLLSNQSMSPAAALSKFKSRFEKQPRSSSEMSRLLTPTSQSPRTTPSLSPPRRISKPAPSPNTMNRLNENDPAFLRTLNALRSPAPKMDLGEGKGQGKKVRPVSYVPVSTTERPGSPVRAKTSLGAYERERERPRIRKSRYESFLERWGMVAK